MKVLITPRGFTNNGMSQIKRMQKAGLLVEYNATGEPYRRNSFIEKAQSADAIIVGVDNIDQQVIDLCPRLKVICKFGVGVDNIDTDYARKKHIYVGRTIGSNSNAVAEHVMALLYCISKNIILTVNDVKEGGWKKPTGVEIRDKCLGIIGFGSIGKKLAQQAVGVGMKVLVNDEYPISADIQEKYRISKATKEEIYVKADYISIHVPLNKYTQDMISFSELNMMNSETVLINAARGGVVNEIALYNSLKKHQIKAAGFDVFSTEPPKINSDLLKLDNFILTPHIAARTVESDINACELSTDIVLDNLGLQNEVN